MHENAIGKYAVAMVVSLGCSAAVARGASEWAAADRVCTGTQCVLVKSAPAVAVCRIVGPESKEAKRIAPSATRTKKASASAVKSKSRGTVTSKSKRTVKAAARKPVRATTAQKRSQPTARRSTRTGR